MTTPTQPVFDELNVRPPEITVDAPGPLDRRPSFLRRIDRWWALTLVLALAFPLVTIRTVDVLSSGQLRAILEWPLYRFGHFSSPIVGLAHGRPLEVCPS